MKRKLLARYARNDDGSIIIDVSAEKVEDLYNNFDRSSPYIRRDLDKDLADYLASCVREIAGTPFVIRFTLSSEVDDSKLEGVRKSIQEYFVYLQNTERQSISHMFRRSVFFFLFGLGILFISGSTNEIAGVSHSVLFNVFAEGLSVVAWVSLWESVATFLIGWFPCHKTVLVYRRIVTSEMIFRIKNAEPEIMSIP